MDILITSIKDYHLLCEEYDSKGITWKSGASMLLESMASLYVLDILEDNRSIILILRNNLVTWNIINENEDIDYVLYEDYIKNKNVNIIIV